MLYYIMELQIMAAGESYLKSTAAFSDRGNYREVFANAVSKICTDVKLGGVRSCLAIGPNEGLCEIEFIKRCQTNISKFIAVEPDHASAEQLRRSLRSSLPGVESQVFETTVQNWKGPDVLVDLIMMFQVLYRLSAVERQEFLKTVHDSWLVFGGYVAVQTNIRTKLLDCTSTSLIFEQLGTPLPTSEEIEADFLKAGFTKHYEHEMRVKRDLRDPDEDLIPFYQMDRVITLAELREAMKGLISEGNVNDFHVMTIFKSTN